MKSPCFVFEAWIRVTAASEMGKELLISSVVLSSISWGQDMGDMCLAHLLPTQPCYC